jgi:hypothetical protein
MGKEVVFGEQVTDVFAMVRDRQQPPPLPVASMREEEIHIYRGAEQLPCFFCEYVCAREEASGRYGISIPLIKWI